MLEGAKRTLRSQMGLRLLIKWRNYLDFYQLGPNVITRTPLSKREKKKGQRFEDTS